MTGTPTTKFTWVPLYTEIGNLLVAWESRQGELIQFLESLRTEGIVVTPLEDRDKNGETHLLREIDPFTFLGTFNRGIRDAERLAILSRVKTLLGASSPLPQDFFGVPLLNNQRSWFINYEADRGVNDVKKLWEVFRLAQADDATKTQDFTRALDAAWEVQGVATNLTMGLFWIRPDRYLNLDQVNRKFLKLKLPSKGLNAEFYLNSLRTISQQWDSFTDLSYQAWLVANKTDADPLPKENSYWIVGSSWFQVDPADQTSRFLSEGVWQNGYPDKYTDIVKSMQVGDKIALKATFTQKKNLPFETRGHTISCMTIKAIGTIVANRHDGKTVDVEWDPNFKPKTWYFFTYQQSVWRLRRETDYEHREMAEKLIEFVWNDKPQDHDWFCKKFFKEDKPSNPDSSSVPDPEPGPTPNEAFGAEDIVSSGVFMELDEVERMIDRVRSKKNLILQGAPGVGKSFVAKKLAYAILGEKDSSRVELVQFHQTYSYEDFIRGYRPLDTAGTFGLQDSVFYKFCMRAQEQIDLPHVFIIDEINRGNLSQIFGELLMLIEADKRGKEYAVPLVYQRPNEPRFFVPENVYIIGLMNIADRSLAIVDYALRRRFSFKTLKPQYGSQLFRSWLHDRRMEASLANLIVERMTRLNQVICEDPLLGENFQVGHSFFCPNGEDFSELTADWFFEIVESEIVPLLKEYWFDNPKQVTKVEEWLRAR